MTNTGKPEILITGAGPTGLVAAIELRRLGYAPRIIDVRESGSGLSRAVAVLPSSLALLKPSGVADKLREAGMVLRHAKIFSGSNQLARINLVINAQFDGVLALAQDRTETILRQTLQEQGGEVEFATRLQAIEQDDRKVTCQLEKDGDSTEQQFDYVIAADGAHSSIRQGLGIEFPGYDLPGQWSIADVEVKHWPHPHSFCLFQLPEGVVVAVIPMEPNRLRMVSDRPDVLSLLPVPLNINEIHRQGAFEIAIRQMDDYRHGRVLFAGDAAHAHSPVGGQGMNLGIGDAADLAARIANGTIESYGPARHAIGKAIIAKTEKARRMATATNPLLRATSHLLLPLVSKIGPLRRAFLKRTIYAQSE